MPNYGKIIIAGHLGRDAELKFTPTGKPVTTFSIAVTEKYKDQKTTSWFNCVQFSDKIAQYLTKGKAILVEGSPRIEEWENEGQKQRAFKVIVNSITFLGGGNRQEQENNREQQPADYNPDDVPF